MKKALVIILIAALSIMVAAALAGCGGDGQTEEAKTLMAAGDEAYATGMMDYEGMNEVQGCLLYTSDAADDN